MQKPPFKLALAVPEPVLALGPPPSVFSQHCCGAERDDAPQSGPGRTRLAELDANFHCSVIGTCLTTSELRKLVCRYLDVADASDVDVHHDAVSLAHQGGAAAKALNKALDARHEATVKAFAKARDAQTLGALWAEAMVQGDIPGAYWAVLTHPCVTLQLRQRAFGDVHMLSHLVGSSNRADLRRLSLLESENRELAERLERHQQRALESIGERDAVTAGLRNDMAQLRLELALARRSAGPRPRTASGAEERSGGEADPIAIQSARRERAEQALSAAQREVERLKDELVHLRAHAATLGRELDAVERQFRDDSDSAERRTSLLDAQLNGRRILYVGGRPSSTPAIRDLVIRHKGHFKGHDGGLEDRKGLLAHAVSAADVVVFPVDCIDHDSAGNLKRLCARHGIPYLPLRSASVASFTAAMSTPFDGTAPAGAGNAPPGCLKHA